MPTYDQLMEGARKADAAGDAAGAKRFLELAAQAKAPAQPPKRSAMDAVRDVPGNIASQYSQFYKGLGHGLADPLYGIAQLGMHGVEAAGQAIAPESSATQAISGWRQSLDEALKANEQRYQAETQQNPWWAGGGRIAGNVAATAPAVSAAPATLPAAAASGAAVSATMPVTEGDSYWTDKLTQTGIGAAGGAAGNLIGRGVARMVAPQTDDAVKALMDRGVTPTPGQIMGGGAKAFEEKMSSYPVVGDVVKAAQRRTIEDFNRAVYDDVLKPIGGQVPKKVGREAVRSIGNQISNAYDDVLKQAHFQMDRQFIDEVTNLKTLVDDLPDQQVKDFGKLLQSKLAKALSPNGRMDGRTFKEIEEAVGDEAAKYAASTDVYQRKLGDAYRTLLNTLRDTLERSNKEGVASRLRDVNTAFAKHVRLEKAAGLQGGETGIFTPAQLSSAVKAADRSSRKRAFSRGEALVQNISDPAKDVIGNTYPDSGTAGRLAALLLTGSAGAGVLNPWLAVPGLATLPYLGPGQRLTAALLAKRPASSPAVAEAIRRSLPAVTAGSAAAVSQP